jgi:hypothetical protein
MTGGGHKGIMLDPDLKHIGFYQKLAPREDNDNCDWGYELRVQSC